MCNWLVCGSVHDVTGVAVAVFLGCVIAGAVIWVIEGGRGTR